MQGDLVMSGYWRLPEKTAETLVDGWLHTGDTGLMDARGYLFLKDRLRDVIITGGFNIYPGDVEHALSAHPAVSECSVCGLPDEKMGRGRARRRQFIPARAPAKTSSRRTCAACSAPSPRPSNSTSTTACRAPAWARY